MAGTSLLLLLDDIATVLDDVALLSKVATKKTAGVLGDDLALNAQQVSGVAADRELPVVWAVAKGSFVNKLILVPSALLLSVAAPWAVRPLLMLGGLYLCFEGVEKLAHKYLHPPSTSTSSGSAEAVPAPAPPGGSTPSTSGVAGEREKIRGAVRTDFVLSAEIIVISLGTVAQAPWPTRLLVLCAVSLVMTVGVYGLVAGIVKLDDAGLALAARSGTGVAARGARWVGRALVVGTPWFMRGLSVAGTLAMFLVGGGILVHGLPWLHELAQGHTHPGAEASHGAAAWATLLAQLVNAAVGLAAGAAALGVVAGAKRLLRRR